MGFSYGGTISNSYAGGVVTGYNAGGLVGYNYYEPSTTITNSYYDTQTSGQSDTGKGQPETTLQMHQQNTFTDWDFSTIWRIDEGHDYPRLRWQKFWHTLGNAGFSPGISEYVSFALDSNGTPYVAFSDKDNSGLVSVMKYDGSNWALVGQAGFSPDGAAQHVTLAIAPDDTLYVAFIATGHENSAEVMQFNGSDWINAGSASVSTGSASGRLALQIDQSGNPWLAMSDGDQRDRVTVRVLQGSNWQTVGQAGFSYGMGQDIELVFAPNGMPIVAYSDSGVGGRAVVSMFDGVSWSRLGDWFSPPESGISEEFSLYSSVALDKNGKIYVAYADKADGYKATVKRYTDSGWEVVGNADFTAGQADYLQLFIHGETPYVGFTDAANSGASTVMKFNGTVWESLGTASSMQMAYNRFALNAEGDIFVAYQDVSNGRRVTVMEFASQPSEEPVAEPQLLYQPSCLAILTEQPLSQNGIYTIDPDGNDGNEPFQAYCAMQMSDGNALTKAKKTPGGWTLVAAQFGSNSVKNWNAGIKADYDPRLISKKSFALKTSQLPKDRMQVAFGKNLDPVFAGYSNFRYQTGNIGKKKLKNLKTGKNHHIFRHKNKYFEKHNPEGKQKKHKHWNNSLTYDAEGGDKFSWAFMPNHKDKRKRGYGLNGKKYKWKQDFAWSVWVR